MFFCVGNIVGFYLVLILINDNENINKSHNWNFKSLERQKMRGMIKCSNHKMEI